MAVKPAGSPGTAPGQEDQNATSIEQYNAMISARWGAGVVGGENADEQESLSNTIAQNAAIRLANSEAEAHNAPIMARDNTWYAAGAANAQTAAAAAATTATNYQDTLTSANSGGNGPAATEQALVTSGGFTPAQATQLANWYQTQIDNQVPPATIQEQLWQQPAVKERYPAIAMQQAKGIPPISITDYNAIEQSARGMAGALGLPASAVSQQDITNAIVNNVPVSGGADSIEGRLTAAHAWASNAMAGNPAATQQLKSLYGVGLPDLVHYALTNDEGVLTNKLTASSIAGNLQNAGFTALDKNQMLGLASAGVSGNANQQEQTAGTELGLTGLGGSRLSGTSLSQSELISAALGANAVGGESTGQAALALKRAQAGAAAKFSGGGNYGTGGQSAAGSAAE